MKIGVRATSQRPSRPEPLLPKEVPVRLGRQRGQQIEV